MSDKPETIADIIAEMRRHAEQFERACAEKLKLDGTVIDRFARDLVATVRHEADRLEAAWKHEKSAIEADALAVGGLVEAALKRESGNAAKLREALIRVLRWLKRMNAEPLNTLAVSELTPSYAVNRAAKSMIEDNDYHISQLTAALAAPPRNCERFQTWDEAKDAYWREQGDPCDWRKLGAWLFAPYEGETKGNGDEK